MQRAAHDIPQLTIEAPAQLAAARIRLESFDTGRLRGVMKLVGLDAAGDPIRVVLEPEGSALARRAPPPIAGFASLDEGLIVLFPARSPAYPHDTLEDVLHHEVAHVLISRAARGAPVPRWFHEGLAVMAERTWRLEDHARLLRELVLVLPIFGRAKKSARSSLATHQGRPITVAFSFHVANDACCRHWNG